MFRILRLFTTFSTFLFNPFVWILAHVSGRYVQQMEKFKACEKEMKTKAFSKEGLIQAAKLDPKEQEKEEAMQWVNHQVEELQMQVEQTEAELETMQGAGKKRKGSSGNPGRQEELERLNERRKWHIGRLEIVLRMLNNGSLALEKVNELKEDVSYFVESNAVRETRLVGFEFIQLVCYRKRISMKMREYTTSFTWMRRKRNSA
jgi:rubrerythrin